MNKRDDFFVLSDSAIGDGLFLWMMTLSLARHKKSITFATYYTNLYKEINYSDNIKVTDLDETKIARLSKNKNILTNYHGEKINGKYIPIPFLGLDPKNYEFVDLHCRQKLGRTTKLETLPDLMWRKVKKIYNLPDTSLVRTVSKFPYLSKQTQHVAKYPWLKKPYVIILEGTSLLCKKYLSWDSIRKRIERKYKINTIIVKDPSSKLNGDLNNIKIELSEAPFILGNSNCNLVIGSDTGLCHLSTFLKTHTAIIYCISDPSFWSNGSKYLHPIVGNKNKKYVKYLQKNDYRLDRLVTRGNGLITPQGVGANLTSEREIMEVIEKTISLKK